MNSGEIIHKLSNYSVMREDKKNIDKFMLEREKNVFQRRRHSISNIVTTGNYFNLERISPMKVFPNLSYGAIDKVIETQVLQ